MVSLLGPTFRENLTRPLVDQSKGKNPNGVDQVIDFLDHYDLTKEDMDNIIGKSHIMSHMGYYRITVCITVSSVENRFFIETKKNLLSGQTLLIR